MISEEVVLADNGSEVVLSFTLYRGSESLESSKAFRVVNALLKVVELRLTDSHLAVHLEQAFSGFIERFKAHRLELETRS